VKEAQKIILRDKKCRLCQVKEKSAAAERVSGIVKGERKGIIMCGL
jgi:hypothetical protein